MTTEERNIKLKHLITCMKCETSGKACDENCPTQYEAGNMGEIIENLEAISEILEQQACEDAVSRNDKRTINTDGLEEGIRCAMCTNPMANDRGCDGGCVVNESMYQNVLNVIKKQILEQQPCDDCISRQEVLDIIMPYCQDDDGSVENTGDLRNALDDIESLPPVTPEEKTEWTPVKYRDMTQEEIEQYSEYTGATKMFDCKMPEDGQEILVSTRGGYVYADTCEIDDMYGIGLENCGDWEDILAWMPMPEPYKEVGK